MMTTTDSSKLIEGWYWAYHPDCEDWEIVYVEDGIVKSDSTFTNYKAGEIDYQLFVGPITKSPDVK